MMQNPYGLERLIADRRGDMLREAEQARLARGARPQPDTAQRQGPRARLAEALRTLADRLEPSQPSVWGANRGRAA